VESDDLTLVIPGREYNERTRNLEIPGLVLTHHPGMTMQYLDENRARLYSRAHEQRRDHHHRTPPPHISGTGGHLRLRYQPLPPDPVRGILLTQNAV
jgi:hypothetical protein